MRCGIPCSCPTSTGLLGEEAAASRLADSADVSAIGIELKFIPCSDASPEDQCEEGRAVGTRTRGRGTRGTGERGGGWGGAGRGSM